MNRTLITNVSDEGCETKVIDIKVEYLHENPVRRGLSE